MINKKLIISVSLGLVGAAIVTGFSITYFQADRRLPSVSLSLSSDLNSAPAGTGSKIAFTASLSCSRKSNNTGKTINFSTNFGTLSADQGITDSSCRSTVYLNSAIPGYATVTARYSTTSQAKTVSFTDPGAVSYLLSDDFSGTLSKWIQVYNGYGTIAIENGELSMAPKVSTQPTETHAPLVAAGQNTWSDIIFTSRMKTVSQLRTGSAPNAWEVGWLIFRYTDDNHFYYFIHKPNGIELGKEILNAQGVQDQQYLVTKTTPTMVLGQWNNYKVVLKGANIKVYINDVLAADYTDTSSPYLTGKIGLYNEDAHTHHDDVTVAAN